MRNRIYFILVLVLLYLFCAKNVLASECSPVGYSIYTINGINTDEKGARDNKKALENLFTKTYNNQPLTVDYLYNPTHLAGLGDLVDAVSQGLFDQKSDYDLVEMLNDASQKVSTQKLLLVAHSQGNFYANNFYDKVASQEGGVPSQSIGVYSVATPANRVGGGGKYLTSDTDNIIASEVARFVKILPPNVHIPLAGSTDSTGHSFSDVYLQYQGDRIVSDIKTSLDKLKNNDEQDPGDPCISAPELSMSHKAEGAVLAVADPVANVIRSGISATYNAGAYVVNGIRSVGVAIGNTIGGLSANVVGSLPTGNSLTAGPLAGASDSTNSNPTQNPKKTSVKTNTGETAPAVSGGKENTNILGNILSFIVPSALYHRSGGGSIGGSILALAEQQGVETPPETSPAEEEPVQEPVPEPTPDPVPTPDPGTETPPENPIPPDPVLPVPDTTAPVISINGDNPASVVVGNVYTDAGATATDDVDTAVSVVSSGTVDTTIIGTYTITYTATDLAGNITTATRTVNVVALPPPPPPLLNTLTIDKNTTLTPGEYNYDNLVITNNATLTLQGDPTSANSFKGVKITAINLTIDPGSSISADQAGYGPNSGPGASSETSIGASYGGFSYNGASSSATYGSATKPTDLGSGGINSGGGAISIEISNTFTNNGTVSADGGISSSGGSIYVSAKNVAGSGILRADGGGLNFNSYFKSPGSGGRIALYYQTSSFDGIIKADGGCGQYDGMTMSCGQNGTIGIFDEALNDLYLNGSWKFLQADAPFSFNNIYVSNGAKVTSENDVNITASNMLVDKNSSFTLADNQVLNIPTITIDGGSSLTLSGSETITANTLNVKGANSTVTVVPEKILSLTIPNIIIDPGASISAYAKGYGYGVGPGTPTSNNYGGASYGGLGGGNLESSKYGSETEPVDFGSGGYGYNKTRGGGAIRLIVSGSLSNDGVISANGDVTSSGGSLYITANNLSGSGIFSASGGGPYCGGNCYSPGGGGRVAVYYGASSFTGQITASGVASGAGNSGDGTVKIVDTSTLPILPPSSLKAITAFNFSNLTPAVTGVVEETNHAISLTVPFGTDVKAIVPTISISEKASISPDNNTAQNFTNPITYTITAEDGSTQNYIVTVTIAPDTTPIPDPTPPSITNYTFNGTTGDITTDPTTAIPLSMLFTASKKVDWVSIKIDKENNESGLDIYKTFQPGADCDGKNTCAQDWDGELSRGGVIQDGDVYNVKVRIKDLVSGKTYDYIPPSVITISIPLAQQ
jgi:outer membrane biosynthesis protein TonB